MVVLIAGALAGCVAKGPVEVPREPCTNHALDEVVSPAGNLKAVIFERRCGKPTAFSTQVSLMAADGRLTEAPGNVLIAGNGGRVSRGRSFVTVAWDGPKTLRVTLAADAAVFRTEPTVGPVKIAYFRRNEIDGAPAGPTK
jgi:predicted small lipoprotein YifL